jgi:hypothetical protein
MELLPICIDCRLVPRLRDDMVDRPGDLRHGGPEVRLLVEAEGCNNSELVERLARVTTP